MQEKEKNINQGKYLNMSLKNFVISVGSRTVTPGGGCVAALVSSLGSALTCMVAFLSYGNRKFENFDSEIRECIPSLYQTYHELTHLIDQDANAFNLFVVILTINDSVFVLKVNLFIFFKLKECSKVT